MKQFDTRISVTKALGIPIIGFIVPLGLWEVSQFIQSGFKK